MRIVAQSHARGCKSADDRDRKIRPRRAQKITQSDERARQQWQALSRLLKYLYHLRTT